MSNRIHHIANKFIDVKVLFPKSKIDLRKTPTPYQTKKIRAAMREFEKFAGSSRYLEKDFVQIKRTKPAREFMEKSGYPKAARGVLLQGGAAVNRNVQVKKGVLLFERHGVASGSYPLNAESQEAFSADLLRHRYLIEEQRFRAYLSTAGGRIKSGVANLRGRWLADPAFSPDTEENTEFNDFYNSAMGTFEYYAALTESGGMRANGRRAAHPSRWGLSVVLEERTKKTKRAKRGKK